MSAALKAELVPALRCMGFRGAFPHFERDAPSGKQLVSVLYQQSGGEFLLEFGFLQQTLPPEGEATIAAEHLPSRVMYPRARLQTESGRWFNFKRYGSDEAAFHKLAGAVSALLPQMEQWFATRAAGPNVHALAI